ncbi:MAG: NAD-dependent epimerase/dehydratase family protein, partial [Spirochaetaceae bacterium]
MEKIVITGGLGFLGQYTATSLIEKYPQAQVIILARSQRPVFLADIKNHPRLQIEYGIDLLKPETMEAFFANADLVVHGAAMVSFWRKDRKKMLEQNWGGTRVVLDLCKKNAVGKLVYISSTAAIGYSDDKDMPADENLDFDWSKAGKYAYAYSKYLAEQE